MSHGTDTTPAQARPSDPSRGQLPAELPIVEATGCGCHEVEGDLPVLDARAIPHAVRHGAIFGALASLRPGQALVLVAPHDPLPLLAQIDHREAGAIDVSYLQRGPDAWRLRLGRLEQAR